MEKLPQQGLEKNTFFEILFVIKMSNEIHYLREMFSTTVLILSDSDAPKDISDTPAVHFSFIIFIILICD